MENVPLGHAIIVDPENHAPKSRVEGIPLCVYLVIPCILDTSLHFSAHQTGSNGRNVNTDFLCVFLV